MKIRYLGHSCFQIFTKGAVILVDPFITPNDLASHIDVNEIESDVILITHGHGDHVQDAETIARRTKAKIVSNYEITEWFATKGVEGHGMNHGGTKNFDFGTVKYVNAVHSSTLPIWTPGGNPGGFLLWNDEGCLYIAGDTALTMDMKLIPLISPGVTLAILPIGDNYTMGYEDAVHAADFVQCDRVLGCHYDTFREIEIDKSAAEKTFADAGKELILLDIGAELEV